MLSRTVTTPLTPRASQAIRLQLALIPVYAWLLFAWSAYVIDLSPHGRLDRSGHIKGHDFAHFYVLGQIAVDRAPEDLYSFDAQAGRTDKIVPEYEDRFLPVHPPQVALFFAPLALLPYVAAASVWLLLSAIIYAACCVWLWRALPSLRGHAAVTALLCAGFPAFYNLIAAGQTSAFALGWFTLGYLALKHGRPWLAGLALGALVYKPSLGLVLPVALIVSRQFTLVMAAALSAALQFVAAWAYFGQAAVVGYFENFRSVAQSESALEAQPHLMHSLRTFFSILLPWPTMAWLGYFLTGVIVIVIAVRTWRTAAPLELRYAVLVLATLLVDPHVYSYELVVLAAPFFLIAAWAIKNGRKDALLWSLLCLGYYLPALGVLANVTRLQLSVPVLLVLMIVLARSARRSPAPQTIEAHA